jgi:hypothetical protein
MMPTLRIKKRLASSRWQAVFFICKIAAEDLRPAPKEAKKNLSENSNFVRTKPPVSS